MAGPRQCGVCSGAESKYKCPSCLLPYCSLGCFKKHKEVPCQKSSSETNAEVPCQKSSSETNAEVPRQKSASETTAVHVLTPEISYQVEKYSWAVPTEMFKSIAESSEIKDALRDEQLKNLICQIDSSKDSENELNKAMEGAYFREFTEKVLSIVSPKE